METISRNINVNDKMKNAFDYDGTKPSFSRATVVNNSMVTETVYVSGTASIGINGETLHKGDFKKQVNQTFENLTEVLSASGFNWYNVVRLTIYLRDIDRDYEQFNIERREFFHSIGIVNYPASTCIESKLCRSDLLVEIELIAMK